MVEDLPCAFLPTKQLAALDFPTPGKLSTEYVVDELIKRPGDCV